MTKLEFDLRFVGVTTGMWLAREQVELELVQLQRATSDVREIVLSRLRGSSYADDEDELNMAYSEIYFLEAELPRLRRNQLLIPIHAAYEFGVVQLAKYCARRLQLRELNGGRDFLKQAARFFRTTCGLPLCDPAEREPLSMLFSLRHAIAHASGEVSDLRPVLRKRVEHYSRRVPGVTVSHGRLELSDSFLRNIAATADQALAALVKRVEKRY